MHHDVRFVPLCELNLSDRRFQLRQLGDRALLRRSIAAQGQMELVDVLEFDQQGPPSLLVIDGFSICELLVEFGIPTVRVRIFTGLTFPQARRHAVCRELERLYPAVQAQLRKSCGDHLRRRPFLRGRLEPDDLAQELWLKAMRSLFPLGCKPRTDEQIRAHLGQMVVDVLLDSAKRYLRLKRTVLREAHGLAAEEALRVAGLETGPARYAVRQELAASVEAALTKVAPQDRELIVLARLQGIPLKQAAQRMGLSLDVAKGRLRRALGRLRQAFLSIGGSGAEADHILGREHS